MSEPGTRTLPLNYAQRRSLFATPPPEIYTVEVSLATPGDPAIADVRRAIGRLVCTHEALRSRLVYSDSGQPCQEIATEENSIDRCEVRVWQIAEDDLRSRAIARSGNEGLDPRRHASRCVLYTVGGRVRHVVLTISNLFVDGLGQRVIHNDLRDLLVGRPIPAPGERRQASFYSAARFGQITAANTEHWKEVLSTAPRSCTFTGFARRYEEEVQTINRTVGDGLNQEIGRAAKKMRVSPYMIWTAALSVMVGVHTGQHRHVYRSIAANRYEVEDSLAAANLALPVYVALDGTADDTICDRVDMVRTASLAAHALGMFDANDLLEWLDSERERRGVAFRPAFDVNYLIDNDGIIDDAAPANHEVSELRRVVPERATADLAAQIMRGASTHLRLAVGAPVWAGRPAGDICADLFTVLRQFCRNPRQRVGSVHITPYPGVAQHIRGHRSGIGIDRDAMRALLIGPPEVVAADFEPIRTARGNVRITANLKVDRPVEPANVLRWYTEKQPWVTGSVVPDAVRITLVRQESGPVNVEASGPDTE